jgi:quinoprotein glucose dehydrogenase
MSHAYKSAWLVAHVALIASGLAGLPRPAGAQVFAELFNGNDLAGWSGDAAVWSVQDGAITGRTTGANALRSNTFLVWNGGPLGNFELRLKFRISAENQRGWANSGIQYRSRLVDSTSFVVAGYQADMDLPGDYTGALYEERGRGILAKPRTRPAVQPGEWNDYVIVVEGNRHRFWINGGAVLDTIDADASKAVRSGVLALQLHAGPPMTVQFKDIRLRARRGELGHVGGGGGGGGVGSGTSDWPVYGGTNESIRYSALARINRENVKQLKVTWTFDASDGTTDSELAVNPIVVDGVMYATTAAPYAVALDASTGKLLWRFDPFGGRKVRATGGRNRGVVYWADGSGTDERIFVAVQQFLYALDARTGRPVLSFGGDGRGRIDLRDGLRPNEKLMVSMGAPGIVFKNLLILGSRTGESLPTPPGDIRAIDVRTGKTRWTFHTIPRAGELGYDTWPKDAWTYIGAANNWAGMSLDTARGLVFVPTGSAADDYYGANRVGDNLFANSLIALDAETGKRVWHFQFVRHDIWDRDLPAQPSLIRVKRAGREIDAVAQITKSGHVFLFTRDSGRALFPISWQRYPPSDVEGEVAADSQPLPLVPAPFARQLLTADSLTERTPAARDSVRARLNGLRSAGQFVPLTLRGTIVFPGLDGGGEWGGPAFDPATGLLYVNSNEMPWIVRLQENVPVTPVAGAARAVSGKDLYEQHCASCHGTDMRGSPPAFPSLLNITDRITLPEIRAVMTEGSGRMPGFAHLNGQVLSAIQSYVVSRERVAVSLADAARVRAAGPIDQRYHVRYEKFQDPDGYPAVKPPWGTLSAIDLSTGRYVWRIPFGEHPALAAQGVATTGSENYGGSVVTAGGLLFIGATNFDHKFRAFDKATGELLWETTMPGSGNATPATYEVDGRQFVVIATSHGKSRTQGKATYVAFALDPEH